MTGQVQTAPAPHFTRTEFRPGGIIYAACPCGWRAVASSHEHSISLGDDHRAERKAAEREAARASTIAELGL